jgi:hypothetical protein
LQKLSSTGNAPRGTYAVLARVSPGYPPCMGRLLTCYAPVRHWAPKDPVRLACVKRAASVRPEPGSNSPLENPNSSLEQTLIRLLGIRVDFRPVSRHSEDTMPPLTPEGERATGRTAQALPNTLIVKFSRTKSAFSFMAYRPVSPGPPRRPLFRASLSIYNRRPLPSTPAEALLFRLRPRPAVVQLFHSKPLSRFGQGANPYVSPRPPTTRPFGRQP